MPLAGITIKAFEQAPIGMAIVGPDRRPQFTNPAMERILGRDAATIQTLRFDDFTHPEDLDTDLCLFQELLAGQRSSYRMTKRYLRPDGTLVWGDLSVALLPARDGGAPLPLGLVQDITEQRLAGQARAAAEQALQRYSAKLEAFSELTTRYQPPAQHLPALLNYGCQSLGVELAALAEVSDQRYRVLVAVGDTVADSHGPAGPVLLDDLANDPLPVPRHPVFGADLAFLTRMDLTWSDAEGVIHQGILDLADRVTAPVLGQPEQQILTLMAQRISANLREQAVLDGLLQARQREIIGHLAAGVAHDFNNVLGVIGSNLHYLKHLLSAAAGTGEARQVLAETEAAIAQAKVVTSGLLSLGRGEEVSVDPCPLGELVQDFAPVIQRLLPPGIALTLDLTPEISVLSNPALLQAALLNLALNARDAMGAAGQLTIRVTAQPTAGIAATGPAAACHEGHGELCVVDTGVGITAAVRARLFEPLFSTKARGRGTGLGLFMVQEFARRSHGAVQITSTPGEGTCVRLRLPLSPRSMTVTHGANQDLVRSGAARAPDPSGGRPAILLVDDEPLVCKALRRPLEQAGYRVREAVDGADALDHLADEPTIGLVLSDIAMPRLDGLALHHSLCRNRPELPVILMSGDPAATADARARNPTLRILSKPVDTEALLAVLRGILGGT
ncbi:ATP-binding protein [uncultured Lamprocystis sp.]|jgi:PAS domain S-box-containing protein|uniref:ATP-binding protein n=1 Tax=uncultured Lamprocystis sp. TaxID=543132 RepID=UPI0025D7566E|nr:ATP-binding protein [uncultured Lamprocystis sp.]